MSAAAQVLLSRPDWVGLGPAPFSTMATQGLLAAQQSKDEIEAGLARTAMGELGASARQKSVTDAGLKQAEWAYTRSPRTSLAQRLALLSQVGGLGGVGTRTSSNAALGAQLIASAGGGGLGGPAQRMAGGVQSFQALLNTTDVYGDALRGVAAQAVANQGRLPGLQATPGPQLPGSGGGQTLAPASTVDSTPWASLFQSRA